MTTSDTRHAAVIGNGLMGAGIAQVFVAAGWAVTLIGRDAARLDGARATINAGLAQFTAHGLRVAEGAPERLRLSTTLADAATAEIVVEAVTEDLALKRRIFADLDSACPPEVILASSSGQPASALIDEVARPDRVIATHFWYPAPLIPVVEVAPGPQTAPEITARACAILRAIGKDPVELRREVPGMIGNRLQFALLREAWALWAAGVASADDIDRVVRQTIGRRLGITGPLESAEIGGLETLHSFAQSLLPHLDARPAPDAAITALVAEGGGTHDWSRRDAAALRAARAEELFRWLARDQADAARG